jgi:hypothetical protein
MMTTLAGLAACSLNTRGGADVQLDAVRPDSVIVASGAIVQVVLHGHGFVPGVPGRNTVMFDTYALNDVPANEDGTQIRLVIPEQLPSGGEAAPIPLDAGPHAIRVKTPIGVSNAATVRVFR